jgi:hypothetical protein
MPLGAVSQQHDYAQPLYRNFHETVAIGESSFRVTVPRSYAAIRLPNGETLRRRFKFTELNVTPGFYSQRALVLGVDGDGVSEPVPEQEDLSLQFALGYVCLDSLYFAERPDGTLFESPYDQGNVSLTLQEFVKGLNAKFQVQVPTGFTPSPLFFDWVDLQWYEAAEGEQEEVQQDTHNSADQTAPLSVDPATLVVFNSEAYYGVEYGGNLEAFKNALPASVRNLTGANNFLLPTTLEAMADVRIRLHVAPNATASFSSNVQLEALGFTSIQVGGRGLKNRYHLSNLGSGSDYLVFTGNNPPSLELAATVGRVYCKPTRESHVFDEEVVKFPAGTFSSTSQSRPDLSPAEVQRRAEQVSI